jgi:selenoprotein W-related protein
MAQELLTTFENEITSITLIPSKPPSPGGIFTVTLNGQLLWDRKVDGGFPESKQIKQKVRDVIAPDKSLGHSDVTKQPATISTTELIVNWNVNTTSKTTQDDCIECKTREDSTVSSSFTITNHILPLEMTRTRPNLCITYPNRNYMFRSAWLAQEILTSMQEEMGSVTLVPTRINVDEMVQYLFIIYIGIHLNFLFW